MKKFHTDSGTAKLNEQSAIAALAGDSDAFTIIVSSYERSLFAFLGRMGFDRATAADLAQDTFVLVWRHRTRFDPRRGTITAWLFGIARNLALTEFRRSGRRPTDKVDDGVLDHLIESEDASHSAERVQRHNQLHVALQRLPDADRTAIALSYVEGLSAPEAAVLLGCRADAYRTRLTRARKRLAKILENSL